MTLKTMEQVTENDEPILIFESRKLRPKGLFDRVVIRFLECATVFSSLALTAIIVSAAFMRYVVRGDLYGYEEWVKLLAFWLYFMGGAYGAYNDTHVSADLIDSYLPEGKTRQIMIFVRQLITSAMSLVFMYFGYYFFIYGLLGPLTKDVFTIGWNGVDLTFNSINFLTTRAIARTTVWQIPLWTSYTAIFLGLILMSVYFSRRCIHTGVAILTGKRDYGNCNNTRVSDRGTDARKTVEVTSKKTTFVRQLMITAMFLVLACCVYNFLTTELLRQLPQDVLTVSWNGVDLIFKPNENVTPYWALYASLFLGLILMSICFSLRCIYTGITLLKGEGGKK